MRPDRFDSATRSESVQVIKIDQDLARDFRVSQPALSVLTT
jgi:hypothetical protein